MALEKWWLISIPDCIKDICKTNSPKIIEGPQSFNTRAHGHWNLWHIFFLNCFCQPMLSLLPVFSSPPVLPLVLPCPLVFLDHQCHLTTARAFHFIATLGWPVQNPPTKNSFPTYVSSIAIVSLSTGALTIAGTFFFIAWSSWFAINSKCHYTCLVDIALSAEKTELIFKSKW